MSEFHFTISGLIYCKIGQAVLNDTYFSPQTTPTPHGNYHANRLRIFKLIAFVIMVLHK